MKKKLFRQEQLKSENGYNKLKDSRKKLKRHTFIMIIFLFGVNAFAWFTYISKADFNFNATVVAWDVNFYSDSAEVNDVVIDVGDIYPGFGDTTNDSNNIPYKKIIGITNNGEVSAKFDYNIKSFTIMGQDAIIGDYSRDEIVELMGSRYPFTIELNASSDRIDPGEKLDFEFSLYWLYEDETKYFKLNQIYNYDPSLVYYTYSNGSFTPASVNETTFMTMRDSLYLEKDDADSYFGSKCAEYEANTGKKCVSVDIQLKVSQILK